MQINYSIKFKSLLSIGIDCHNNTYEMNNAYRTSIYLLQLAKLSSALNHVTWKFLKLWLSDAIGYSVRFKQQTFCKIHRILHNSVSFCYGRFRIVLNDPKIRSHSDRLCNLFKHIKLPSQFFIRCRILKPSWQILHEAAQFSRINSALLSQWPSNSKSLQLFFLSKQWSVESEIC